MTDLLPRLAVLPALRAAAEEQARALTDTIARAGRETPFWDALPERMRLERVNAHLSRLLDPTNPAAEGVLADLYRRETGRESAHAVPPSGPCRAWRIRYVAPIGAWTGASMGWFDAPGSDSAVSAYAAWARALLAHYDLAARKDGSGF